MKGKTISAGPGPETDPYLGEAKSKQIFACFVSRRGGGGCLGSPLGRFAEEFCRGGLPGSFAGEVCWGYLMGRFAGQGSLGEVYWGRFSGEICWGGLVGRSAGEQQNVYLVGWDCSFALCTLYTVFSIEMQCRHGGIGVRGCSLHNSVSAA